MPDIIQVENVCRGLQATFFIPGRPDVALAIKSGTYKSAKHHFVEEGYFEGRLPHGRDQPELQSNRGVLGTCNSYYSLDSSNQQLRASARLTKTALDNLQVAPGRYQPGVGSILDVLTAQSAAPNAGLLRINAELGWQVARAQFALGRLSGVDPLHIP